jgi:hypothetical protein
MSLAPLSHALLALVPASPSRVASPDPRLVTVTVDSARREVAVRFGPFTIAAMPDGMGYGDPYAHRMDGMGSPFLSFDWPVTGWLRGFRLALTDGAGRPLSRQLIHHVAMVNVERRALLQDAVERILAAGRETEDVLLPASIGLPLSAGTEIGMLAAWANETGAEIAGAYLTVTITWSTAHRSVRPVDVLPLYFDVNYQGVGQSNSYDLPAGPSSRSEEFTLPVAGFERLFGDGDSTDPAARMARLEEQRSILDYVAGSIDRLETKLGSTDRSKLTEYLEAIRDIERRIQKAEQQNASLKIPVIERPSSVPETFAEHARLMMDLQVLVFQTDMTRVITYVPAREGSNRSYREIGISDGHHSITHHQNDPEKIDNVAKIDNLLVQTFAYLLEKLKATPDGDGSLLDHSIFVYGSGTADGNRHTHHDLPVLVAGGGAGQIKGGRHLRYPQETPLNNLYLNILEKAGVQSGNFGDSTGHLTDI